MPMPTARINAATNGVRTWASSSDPLFGSVVTSGRASAKSIEIARVAGSYVIGALVMGVSYSNMQYGCDNISTFGKNLKFNSGAVVGTYLFTPASRLSASYNYTQSSGAVRPVNLGYDYCLSARTDLYVMAAGQKSSGTSLSTTGQLITADASIDSYNANSDAATQGLSFVGMRHRF
jgi:predicted porin